MVVKMDPGIDFICNESTGPLLYVFKVPLHDLQVASEALIKALMIREKYMAMSLQTFPKTTSRFLQGMENKDSLLMVADDVKHESRSTIEGEYLRC